MINTNLVIGRLGSGKTTCIKHLIDNKPDDEYWIIIVNEFGQVGIDTALIETPQAHDNLNIKEITGGCVCCAARSQLQVALTSLIRLHKPDRILIEATGLGHPAGIIDLLRDEYLNPIINISSIITVLDLSLFSQAYDAKNSQSPLTTESFSQQTQLADVVVLNKADLTAKSNIQHAKDYLSTFYPAKQKTIVTTQGQINIEYLSLSSDINSKPTLTIDHDNHYTAQHKKITENNTTFDFFHSENNEHMSFGFIYPPQISFVRKRLQQLFEFATADTGKGIIRLKAVFNCGRLWHSFNGTDHDIATTESSYRRDSRIEIITSNKSFNIDEFRQALYKCIKEKNI